MAYLQLIGLSYSCVTPWRQSACPYWYKNYIYEISFKFPRGQGVKSESHSHAPFNLFQAPLTSCLGSLLWSTPLQNSLISIKISRAGLRQIPIYWFPFFCSNDSACNSYQRSLIPCHIGHAGFVQQYIRWWPGWRFMQCSPPVGGVVCLSPGSRKHFGKIFFYTL